MSANTKILVFKKKEILYTLIFLILGVILAFLLITMFGKKDSPSTPTNADADLYIPGIYTSVLSLGNQSLEVEVCVDAAHIKSIGFTNLDESIATVYPLMGPSMESLAQQIIEHQSADNVSYAQSSKYTCTTILNSIRAALAKAAKGTT